MIDLKKLRSEWSAVKPEHAGIDGPIILALIDRCDKAEAAIAEGQRLFDVMVGTAAVVDSKLRLRCEKAEAALATAQKEIEDIQNSFEATVSGNCAPDEKHCFCVPALRAALATAEHCGKDYATERACGECLRCLRTMCEIEAEGNCNRTMEICALQAALATAREKLKQLEARDYFQKCLEDPEMRKKVAAEWMNEENIELRAALATSRALAFEEAAREVADWKTASEHLRALAPLPPSLMAIPREVVEEIKQAGRMMLAVSACRNGCDPSDMTCATNRQRAALSALEGAME